MANISVTYTFSNSTTADATQVNQNFTDIINGTSDGTKDMSISALTCAGTATLNGNVTLGNAAGDDITFTGSMASSLPIKTTASYDIGSSTLGLAGIYFGANSQTVRLVPSGSMSATYTMTLPVNAGTQGQGLETNGSGVLSFKPMQTDTSAKSADYTITDGDGISVILMTTSTTDRTVTLPTAADNSGRKITVIKVDSASGKCTIDGEGAETIDGATTLELTEIYSKATMVCDGSNWFCLERPILYERFVTTAAYSTTGSNVTVTDWTHTLTVGRTYRINMCADVKLDKADDDYMLIEIKENGSTISSGSIRVQHGGTETNDQRKPVTRSMIFKPTDNGAMTVIISGVGIPNTAQIVGASGESYLEVEELPNHVVTTAF